ncbi:MAG: lipoyl(octanoyl) transferase LipB [Deltaproteobacteria bacterium]|nr:lipoyl(octanoyl) transferase LipB [Deltaproteobacteria bacterium]
MILPHVTQIDPLAGIDVRDLGAIPYRAAWALQEEQRHARAAGTCRDVLLLCEHPPVITLGRQPCAGDWRATPATVREAGIDVVETNRGGRMTYHGPGQLVGYWIVDLSARQIGIRDFVRMIESLLIATVTAFGIRADRDPLNPGLWVGREKLAALGLHVRRGITQHGFALNYAVDLSHYRYFVPCGLSAHGVTSLHRLCATPPPRSALISALCHQLQTVVSSPMVGSSPAMPCTTPAGNQWARYGSSSSTAENVGAMAIASDVIWTPGSS